MSNNLGLDADSISHTIGGVGGIGILVAIARYAFKTYKADGRDVKVIDSEVKQLERLEAEVKLLKEDLACTKKQLIELWNLELEGAPDIAVIGVHLQHLALRDCPMARNGECPAMQICDDISEVYARVNQRRLKRHEIFTRKKGKVDDPKPE